MLEKLNIKTDFVDGLRVTDKDTVNVVEMVLSGAINKSIVAAITSAGAKAVGISGKDGGLIKAEKIKSRRDPNSAIEKVVDLGFVGKPSKINTNIIKDIIKLSSVPIISPLGLGKDNQTFNINGDTAAGAIAKSLKCRRLLLMTNVEGVLDRDKKLIPEINSSIAEKMLKDGDISGGMIPKIKTCLDSVNNGVTGVVIVDGRKPHSILFELFSDKGAGTLIRK